MEVATRRMQAPKQLSAVRVRLYPLVLHMQRVTMVLLSHRGAAAAADWVASRCRLPPLDAQEAELAGSILIRTLAAIQTITAGPSQHPHCVHHMRCALEAVELLAQERNLALLQQLATGPPCSLSRLSADNVKSLLRNSSGLVKTLTNGEGARVHVSCACLIVPARSLLAGMPVMPAMVS